jgi:hypothetical protein
LIINDSYRAVSTLALGFVLVYRQRSRGSVPGEAQRYAG